MSVSGLCQVCNAAEAVDRCDRCGTVVCEDHLNEGLGICVSCSAEVPGAGEGGDDSHPDVDRYEF
jgi:methionyl-tRNA synthetase